MGPEETGDERVLPGASTTDPASADVPRPPGDVVNRMPSVIRGPDLATVSLVGAPPESPGTAGFRLSPGQLLAGRYRIVAPLGRGGMGEVYRADDLVLGVPVALKFLPGDVATDPDRLARFRAEVAAARKVAHPNVCRVYDIAEVDGRPFLSMEFIPGSDLAAVLNRAGLLPAGLAIELGRQVALGLQAVHDEGLVHRDLKPANVLIDGRGRAKLADFGLAAEARSVVGPDACAGTPAYQAPEQLSGEGVSTRTDLYSLGVLLYQLLTGRRPFVARARDELRGLQRSARPARLSELVPGLPREVDWIVLRCLAPDPKDRPETAAEVGRNLPGDEALRAALAAGETPTPQAVADSGGEGRLRRRTALALAAIGLLGVGAVCILHDHSSIIRATPVRSPAELETAARAVLRRVGPGPPGRFHALGFASDYDQRDWRNAHDRGRGRLSSLRPGRPSLLQFWYRESARPLIPEPRFGEPPEVQPENPTRGGAGSAYVALDGLGRLLVLEGIGAPDTDAVPPARPDWTALFDAAGLDLAAFRPADPRWDWVSPHDARFAWEGAYPERADIPLRLEGAAHRGRVVGFRLVSPWTPAPDQPRADARTRASHLVRSSLPILMLIIGGTLAAGHIRAGRADLVGARRLAILYAAALFAACLLYMRHTPDAARETALLYVAAGLVLLRTLPLVVAYLGMEPFVRRRWPGLLVAWARLLAGRWRDPRVGRDALIGVAAGAVSAVNVQVSNLAAGWLGYAPELPQIGNLHTLNRWLGPPLGFVAVSTEDGLMCLFALFLLARVFRAPWLWGPAAIGSTLPLFLNTPVLHPVGAVMATMGLALGLVVMLRAGLLAAVVQIFTFYTLHAMPTTYDLAAWYGPGAMMAIAATAAACGYGLLASVGGWRGLLHPPRPPSPRASQ